MSGQGEKSLLTAFSLIAKEEYGRAFAHFLLALTLDPSMKDREDVEDLFIDCLKSWSDELVSLQREKDAMWCHQQACDVWPESGGILHATGQFLFQSGYKNEGFSFLKKACCSQSEPHPGWLWDCQNAASSLVERWHFRMLNDTTRNQSYFDALKRAVARGHRKILDIGSGTGILSMLAVRAGAEHVTACEMNTVMSDLSKLIIEKNNMTANIDVENVQSTDMNLQSGNDRFTLVVTEIADAGLLGEGIIPTVEHAWEHLLQSWDHNTGQEDPPAQVIPAGATVYIQIIESSYIRRQHRITAKESNHALEHMTDVASRCGPMTFDPDESDMEPYSSENLSQIPGGWQALSVPQQVYRFNFDDPSEILTDDHLKEKSISIPIIAAGHADAVISWFELHLDSESTVSSSPESDSCWEQAVYPIHSNRSTISTSADSDSCWEQAVYPIHGNNTVLKVSPGEMVNLTCLCHPTWMSFCVNSVAASENADSNATCSKDECSRSSCSTGNTREKGPTKKALRIASRDLVLLNDEAYHQFIKKSLRQYLNQSSNISGCTLADGTEMRKKSIIVDETGIGLVALLADYFGIPSNQIIRITSSDMRKLLVDKVLKRCQSSSRNIICLSQEDPEEDVDYDEKIVIANLVDSSGVLKDNILEDLYMACVRNPSTEVHIIPGRMRVKAVCVESEELRRNTSITGTESTLGLDVTLINEYKTSTQLNVHLARLPHHKLTENFMAFDIDLGGLLKSKTPMEVFTQKRDLVLEVTDTGHISSIVYWFEMWSGDDNTISTLTEDTHWMQAASMLEKDVVVHRGDKINIMSYLRNDTLSFTVRLIGQ